jgi:glycosyltransferase involved in cell wall biosynthesis
MKVTHLCSTQYGGAGIAAHRLFEALRLQHNEIYFASKDASEAKNHIKLNTPPTRLEQQNWLMRRIAYRHSQIRWKRIQDIGTAQSYYSSCNTDFRPAHFNQIAESDILHLHWVGHLLDWQHCLPWMAAQAKIVWTLHDLNPLQGIWHYLPETEINNPHILQWDAKTRTIKAEVFNQIPADRITFVAPSNWMATQIKSNPATQKFRVETIANTLDTQCFHPIAKDVARKALNIPTTAKVIGFICDDMKDPRKGMRYLLDALESTANEGYTLLTAGKQPSHENLPASIDWRHLGALQSDHLLRLFYSAMDVFVIPSTQDNLPNTVLEAMACGTPCIGFNVGGIPDMIRENKTGHLVRVKDSLALAQTLQTTLANTEHLDSMSKQARAVAESEYSYTTQANKHMSLYRERLSN